MRKCQTEPTLVLEFGSKNKYSFMNERDNDYCLLSVSGSLRPTNYWRHLIGFKRTSILFNFITNKYLCTMFHKVIFFSCILIVLSAFSIPAKVEKKAAKTITKFYDIENFSKENISISETLNAQTTSDFSEGRLFKISEGDTFLGYGYIGNAPSKTATYDYLVLFDKDFIITKSKVLIYREEYGGEIGSKRWLKQFIGSAAGAKKLVYNDDIIPISGATISVQSMTLAINNLLASLKKLQEANAL